MTQTKNIDEKNRNLLESSGGGGGFQFSYKKVAGLFFENFFRDCVLFVWSFGEGRLLAVEDKVVAFFGGTGFRSSKF